VRFILKAFGVVVVTAAVMVIGQMLLLSFWEQRIWNPESLETLDAVGVLIGYLWYPIVSFFGGMFCQRLLGRPQPRAALIGVIPVATSTAMAYLEEPLTMLGFLTMYYLAGLAGAAIGPRVGLRTQSRLPTRSR